MSAEQVLPTERRKRLIIFRGNSQYVNPNSYNVQEIGLGRTLVKLNWDVTIYSSGDREETYEYGDHLRWVELKRKGGKYGWPSSGYQLLKEGQPDLVQIQDIGNLSTYMAYAASFVNKAPMVMSFGEYNPANKLKRIVNSVIASNVRSRIRGVLCKTNSAIEYAHHLRLPNVHYAPVGIDPSAYSQQADEREELLDSLSRWRQSGGRVLAHIGRLDKGDNAEFLLSVAGLLETDCKLVLVGEPKEFVMKLPGYEALKDRIVLTGRVPNRDIGQILKSTDLYMAVSKYEIFGMSAAESIFHGCPVIGFATGGIPEIVTDARNGILMKHRNPKEWAARIDSSFAGNEADRLRQGCESTGHSLTWEHRAVVYDQLYRQVLREEGRYAQ